MGYLVQQLVLGLSLGALYASLAFGYSIAFGVTKRADIAYGGFFAFGGQIYVLFVDQGFNELRLILPAALAFGACVSFAYASGIGLFAGRHIMGPLVRVSPNAVIVAALGLLIVLMETARLASDTRDLWLPPLLAEPVTLVVIGGRAVQLTGMQLLNTGLFSILVATGHYILTRTRFGRHWRAVTEDPLAAGLCGVNAPKVFVVAYVASTMVAAATGMIATNYYGNMDFGSGIMFGLKVLLIAAVGGYGEPLKSAGGAAALGLAETLWGAYAPFVWRDLAVFSLLVFVLVISRRERVIP
ncbi:branched-chain amino acid ABC transporter permease [Gellertiella hungarica]|uniref:Branched-chain amino acid transport system permease protein n=1 Tax=Gellertiella hungarica TaxID=1572859 RepID=A0A7W6J687_9HYPH|nr:branched-chain amino acid ABC transporter permease [Gellertiella hungarica]MBB4065532.1 branched-chain amino acid transport system permease protein [Gellertiella hungarica]